MTLRHIGHLVKALGTKISLRKQGRQTKCLQVKVTKSLAFSSKQIGHKEFVVTIADISA